MKRLPWRAIHRLHDRLTRHLWIAFWRPKWGYMSTLPYFTMLQYIINCGLRIAFGTTTHSDRERSRVGIHFHEVEMRPTTFLEMLLRLTVPFSFVDQSFYALPINLLTYDFWKLIQIRWRFKLDRTVDSYRSDKLKPWQYLSIYGGELSQNIQL
jgi:hypothetical protein